MISVATKLEASGSQEFLAFLSKQRKGAFQKIEKLIEFLGKNGFTEVYQYALPAMGGSSLSKWLHNSKYYAEKQNPHDKFYAVAVKSEASGLIELLPGKLKVLDALTKDL